MLDLTWPAMPKMLAIFPSSWFEMLVTWYLTINRSGLSTSSTDLRAEKVFTKPRKLKAQNFIKCLTNLITCYKI